MSEKSTAGLAPKSINADRMRLLALYGSHDEAEPLYRKGLSKLRECNLDLKGVEPFVRSPQDNPGHANVNRHAWQAWLDSIHCPTGDDPNKGVKEEGIELLKKVVATLDRAYGEAPVAQEPEGEEEAADEDTESITPEGGNTAEDGANDPPEGGEEGDGEGGDNSEEGVQSDGQE